MREKLIELIIEKIPIEISIDCLPDVEAIADHLLANNVFVLPEQMKDNWELALPFMMRLFATDEEQIEKFHRKFERKEVKQILTDIRDYLVTEKGRVANSDIYLLQIQAVEKFADKALAYLTEYAEKLGVKL